MSQYILSLMMFVTKKQKPMYSKFRDS